VRFFCLGERRCGCEDEVDRGGAEMSSVTVNCRASVSERG
jgi:hypothetical protein